MIGGTVWATYQGYNAGQQYGLAQCKTDQKFDDRAANPDTWTPDQEIARRAENISNGLNAYGPFAVRGAFGVALAGAGGSFVGAGLALGGATLGFNAGQKDCKCP